MKNELVFKNHCRGFEVAKTLLDEGYVVMLSYEEEFLVLNWKWSTHGADRNDVVFMSVEEHELELDKCGTELLDDIRNDIKSGFYKDLSDI